MSAAYGAHHLSRGFIIRVIMPMMNIRHVRMGMAQRRMTMRMRMGTDACGICVTVHVMVVVVRVAMLMCGGAMLVRMGVNLADQ